MQIALELEHSQSGQCTHHVREPLDDDVRVELIEHPGRKVTAVHVKGKGFDGLVNGMVADSKRL